jgi:hypothetical protein
MNRFTVNGTVYTAKPFDFNMIADLEDCGVSMEKMQDKPMSMVRAYFSLCSNKSREKAGKEIEEHIIGGGKFDEIIQAMSKEMEESGFFLALSKNKTEEDTAEPEKKGRKTKEE